MSNKYNYLKEQYPEIISVNQFYKICHIAKRSAVYLLKKGIVPYTDTGKKTWKYKILLSDAISYLIMRERGGSKIPRGKIPNGNKKRTRSKSTNTNENFMRYVKPNEAVLVRQFFEQTYWYYSVDGQACRRSGTI